MTEGAVIEKADRVRRCDWCGDDELYMRYHDEEWGRETTDDAVLFEFLVLESMQAGLNWLTILRRRENYRSAFAGFDAGQVSRFTARDVECLMQNPGIIRNRLKIEATIFNAQHFLTIQRKFGSFSAYLRLFLPQGKPLVNRWKTQAEVPVSTPLSDTLGRDLKKNGFRFIGPTVCYAYLQAVGCINDHLLDCSFRSSARPDGMCLS
jgi:DNA-3-methyladenine glycosylase I